MSIRKSDGIKAVFVPVLDHFGTSRTIPGNPAQERRRKPPGLKPSRQADA
jgi:hypothetical protein